MKTKLNTFYRTAKIESGAIDKEKRTVDVTFSSEKPVERWFGKEVLDHTKSSIDMSRLNDGAAVLVDHRGDQIGVVEKANIKDKRGHARLRFSRSKRASEVFDDVVDEIRKNISFGYRARKFEEPTKDEDGDFVYRSKQWEPLEISVVGVPADATIGIGRSESDEYECDVPDSFRAFKEEKNEPIVEAKPDKSKQRQRRRRRLELEQLTKI